jgi:hypothetical protein
MSVLHHTSPHVLWPDKIRVSTVLPRRGVTATVKKIKQSNTSLPCTLSNHLKQILPHHTAAHTLKALLNYVITLYADLKA